MFVAFNGIVKTHEHGSLNNRAFWIAMYGGTKDSNYRENASKTNGSPDTRQRSIVERLSRYGMQVMPGAVQRRTRLQREENDSCVSDRASITAAMRKNYLKELVKSPRGQNVNSSNGPFSDHRKLADWAVYQMEHAWMLSAVEGKFDTLLEFISEDPQLITRRDFITGYTVLHWLAKSGRDDTLLQLLNYAQNVDLNVDVNIRGSGGLTPLHLASMHGQYMVIKLLVGAFGADVDTMDYNGKRAWQYLKGNTPLEIKELLGTWDEDHSLTNVNNNNCTEIFELPTLDKVNCEPQQDNFSMAQGWRQDSFRKLLSSFTFLGRNSQTLRSNQK